MPFAGALGKPQGLGRTRGRVAPPLRRRRRDGGPPLPSSRQAAGSGPLRPAAGEPGESARHCPFRDGRAALPSAGVISAGASLGPAPWGGPGPGRATTAPSPARRRSGSPRPARRLAPGRESEPPSAGVALGRGVEMSPSPGPPGKLKRDFDEPTLAQHRPQLTPGRVDRSCPERMLGRRDSFPPAVRTRLRVQPRTRCRDAHPDLAAGPAPLQKEATWPRSGHGRGERQTSSGHSTRAGH